jgi:hypothetical protein
MIISSVTGGDAVIEKVNGEDVGQGGVLTLDQSLDADIAANIADLEAFL